MDLDSDYYFSRCKDINGLWLFKGTFMTFVGGDSDHQTLLYFTIKELFTVLRWRFSNDDRDVTKLYPQCKYVTLRMLYEVAYVGGHW
jgi:hypothetical protein